MGQETKTGRVDLADRVSVKLPVRGWRHMVTFALGVGLGVLLAPSLLPTLSDSFPSWATILGLATFLLLLIAVDRLLASVELLVVTFRIKRKSDALDRRFEEIAKKDLL